MLNNSGISNSSSQQGRSSSSVQQQQQRVQTITIQRSGSQDPNTQYESLSQQYSLIRNIVNNNSNQLSPSSNASGGMNLLNQKKTNDFGQLPNNSGIQSINNNVFSKLKTLSSRSSLHSQDNQQTQEQAQYFQQQSQQIQQQSNYINNTLESEKSNFQNNSQVNQLKLEIEVLQNKYEDALERLAAAERKKNSSQHNNSQQMDQQIDDISVAKIDYLQKQLQLSQLQLEKEKEKALKVILKLEKDLDSQQSSFDFEKLKLSSQIESLNAINDQLQKEINKLKSIQKESILISQEKDDAESVVKELRKQNQILNEQISALNQNFNLQKQSQDKQDKQTLIILQEQTEKFEKEILALKNQKQEDEKQII
ncbi:hypothetical protein ABPG74_022033 [Tetrahymena malaccensis]